METLTKHTLKKSDKNGFNHSTKDNHRMTLMTTFSPATFDQARKLRELIEQNAVQETTPLAPACRTIAVVGGKGGVGKSMVSLNLAVSLAQQGRSVCLLDASFGLGSLDLMCGLNGYWNLSHVLTGARNLPDVILKGPEGIHLIPGASGLTELGDYPEAVQATLLEQLNQLEQQYEVMIIDTGSGMHQMVRQLALAADQLLVVTTPEPTAITDAYATIKSFSSSPVLLSLVVNCVESDELAQKLSDRLKHTAHMFLQAEVDVWGHIPRDGAVPQSILARHPLITFMPSSLAAKALTKISSQCVKGRVQRSRGDTYFQRILPVTRKAA